MQLTLVPYSVEKRYILCCFICFSLFKSTFTTVFERNGTPKLKMNKLCRLLSRVTCLFTIQTALMISSIYEVNPGQETWYTTSNFTLISIKSWQNNDFPICAIHFGYLLCPQEQNSCSRQGCYLRHGYLQIISYVPTSHA